MTQALRIPIIIDLRGNGGGDLHAAIDTARLFLDGAAHRVRRHEAGGASVREPRRHRESTTPVYVWQDEGTASAAEVFIAGLTDNERAVSIGRGTAGKGTWEEIVESSVTVPRSSWRPAVAGRRADFVTRGAD